MSNSSANDQKFVWAAYTLHKYIGFQSIPTTIWKFHHTLKSKLQENYNILEVLKHLYFMNFVILIAFKGTYKNYKRKVDLTMNEMNDSFVVKNVTIILYKTNKQLHYEV